MTKAAPLTIHLASALPSAPMRGKELQIACAELDVLKLRASLPLSLALPDMLSARWLGDLEPFLPPRPRQARPGLVALLFAFFDRASASKSGAERQNAHVSFSSDAASMKTPPKPPAVVRLSAHAKTSYRLRGEL